MVARAAVPGMEVRIWIGASLKSRFLVEDGEGAEETRERKTWESASLYSPYQIGRNSYQDLPRPHVTVMNPFEQSPFAQISLRLPRSDLMILTP